jgi:tetratricopeptide (TPR) repeat protein
MTPRICLAVSLLLGMVAPLHAQDDWAGKRIILKRPGIKFGYSDDDGKQVYIGELTNLAYTVQKEADGFLRVQHRGTSGWFPKAEAMLVVDAIPYYAERTRNAAPRESIPHAYLGWAYKENDQIEQALAAYAEAIRRDPKPNWYNNRGVIHRDAKRLDLAIADFTEAIKRDPNFALAYENRAAAWSLLGKNLTALADWNDCLRLDPGNAAARIRRAKIFADQKDFDKAIADLNAVLKADPENVAALIDRGNLYSDLQKLDEAIADFTAAIEADGKNPEAYIARSQLYTDQKDFAKALADVEAALKLSPTLVEAVVARGWNRFLTGEYDKALADFAKAREMNPKNPGSYNSQAWMWATCPEEKYRNGKKAVEFAKIAVELSDGKEPAILDTQAAAYAEAGDFPAAVRVQEQVIQSATGPLAAEARERLEKYKKKEPHRQAVGK